MKVEQILKQRDGIPFYTTPDFERHPELAAGFATRLGGVSEGMFAQFNFGFSRGDEVPHVRENYRRFAKALGVDAAGIAAVRQVHSDIVLTAPQQGVANPFSGTPLQSADGVLTATPGIYPVCYFADCIPLLIYAPDRRVCAAVHAGWRGALQNILEKALRIMERQHGVDLGQTLLAIGPSICPHCFEVGEEVAAQFAQAFPDCPELILEGYPKPHVDLWRAVEHSALRCGLRPHNITGLGLCNYEAPERFFSHRRHGEDRGVLMALIGVLPEA
ncbi:MAG: peptidoglycan editing factor PgeF [Clostridiales bacterium]|nr:peptidoglycan editing factor PgeF [Clostridiales bacterium]